MTVIEGHWIKIKGMKGYFRCSECGAFICRLYDEKYCTDLVGVHIDRCPNCKTHMGGKEDATN